MLDIKPYRSHGRYGGKDKFNDYRIKKIFDHYGKNNQLMKLVEECGELITAIARKDEANIIEEMADVSVLISQFIINNPEIVNVAKVKIDRTIERIENEAY
jgi:NTP pyrophosphatase (non-canonical NTP hydrolase)